jgi:hypothetical protein
MWWRSAHLGVLTVIDVQHEVPLETVVVIDDNDEAVATSDHATAWRRWLQMANAFAGADHSVTLLSTTMKPVSLDEGIVMADVRRREVLDGVAPEWAALSDEVAAGVEVELVAALAAAGVRTPVYGAEVADGIPVDFVWEPERVVVVLDVDDETAEDLRNDGWRVVDPDVNAIVEALGAPEGVR